MNKIIAIVGMPGSGKSTLSDSLTTLGWGYVRFGQLTLDTIKNEGLEINEQNERMVRERIRKEHGMAAYATLNLPKFDAVLQEKNLVADGLYSWSEYKILKEYYGDRLTVAAVFAPPTQRYERLANRFSMADDASARNRNIPAEDSKKRDYAEIENIEKGGPIAMADYTIVNIGSYDDYQKEIEKFFTWYESRN